MLCGYGLSSLKAYGGELKRFISITAVVKDILCDNHNAGMLYTLLSSSRHPSLC